MVDVLDAIAGILRIHAEPPQHNDTTTFSPVSPLQHHRGRGRHIECGSSYRTATRPDSNR
ncbi:hypothetical protein [Nocardioides bigeumensis]|uniref:hypothetical protein n=1 Tax=Nocardioides bigeumensis TaxID=433657 RepID=UPI0031E22893